jgi:hypothetical protein
VLSPGVAYIVCVCVCVCECDLVHIFLWNANMQWPRQFRILDVTFLHNLNVIFILAESFLPNCLCPWTTKKEEIFFSFSAYVPLSVTSASIFLSCDCMQLCAEGSQGTHKWASPVWEAVFLAWLLYLPLLVFREHNSVKKTAVGLK